MRKLNTFIAIFILSFLREIDLMTEKVLVVGLGEVGLPIYELLDESKEFLVFGFDVNETKMKKVNQINLPATVDIMHVCMPYLNQKQFVDFILKYIKLFNPKLVIINSTVVPGTTRKIHEKTKCMVTHSPVRGVHQNHEHMKWELKRWTKYVGGADKKSTKTAFKHFQKAGFETKMFKSCEESELAKLFETTYRAWMIACFQEMHRIAQKFNADFNDTADFLEDTHRVRFDRPIMFPGPIGGHCLIPNTELLLSVYESKFLRLILESNEKRKIEIKEEQTAVEIENVKKRSETLEKLMKNRCKSNQ